MMTTRNPASGVRFSKPHVRFSSPLVNEDEVDLPTVEEAQSEPQEQLRERLRERERDYR